MKEMVDLQLDLGDYHNIPRSHGPKPTKVKSEEEGREER